MAGKNKPGHRPTSTDQLGRFALTSQLAQLAGHRTDHKVPIQSRSNQINGPLGAHLFSGIVFIAGGHLIAVSSAGAQIQVKRDCLAVCHDHLIASADRSSV